MTKYERFDKFSEMQQPPGSQIHPIWRGIGCVMFVLIPIVAYAAADTFFDNASGLVLFGSTVFPSSGILFRIIFSFPLWGSTFRFSLFHLVFMILFSVMGFLIFSLVYAVVYRVTGPSMYGPLDAPPSRKTKKRRQ